MLADPTYPRAAVQGAVGASFPHPLWNTRKLFEIWKLKDHPLVSVKLFATSSLMYLYVTANYMTTQISLCSDPSKGLMNKKEYAKYCIQEVTSGAQNA